MITTAACAVAVVSADIPRLDNANPASPIFQFVMPKRKHCARPRPAPKRKGRDLLRIKLADERPKPPVGPRELDQQDDEHDDQHDQHSPAADEDHGAPTPEV